MVSPLNQDHANFEIIIVDDHSTDSTGEKLDELAQRYPQLKVIHAQDNLVVGWYGKRFACQRLAAGASGERLLFADAGTEHRPQSIVRVLPRH